ncbi:MAG: ABC transporter permease [bacterium]
MNLIQPIITIWRREIIRYWRDKTRIVSSFFQPIMFLFIFGAGLSQTLTQGNFGVDFIKFMYPGIIAMNVMGIAFFSTVSTVWDREFGFLKEILVAPIPRTSISIGKALGAATIASLQGLILLIIAPFIGVQLHIFTIIQLFGLMIILSFAIAGIGLLIASLMKTTETFGLVMQVLVFPMFFLSGAFFPLTNVPTWMTVISRINPLTYGVDAMRRVILDNVVSQKVLSSLVVFPLMVNLLFLIGFSVVMISAAVLAFNRKS